MSYVDIRVEHEGPVGLLILARPQALNAVHAKMLTEIGSALDDLAADDRVKAVVLLAEGRHFCAGADFSFLDEVSSMSAVDVRDRIYAQFQGAARKIYRFPKPTLAAIDGAAVTVGCELAIMCDHRIVTERASFAEAWIKLGTLPALGGMFVLPRLIGIGRANEMVLRGRPVKGEEAVRIGLASEVVSADTLRARAIEIGEELAALAPRAYALAKEGLQRGFESSIDREWAAAVLGQTMLLSTDDFKEGVAAAKSKRAAKFAGR